MPPQYILGFRVLGIPLQEHPQEKNSTSHFFWGLHRRLSFGFRVLQQDFGFRFWFPARRIFGPIEGDVTW